MPPPFAQRRLRAGFVCAYPVALWFTLKNIKKKQHISSSSDVLAPNPTSKAVESMNAISNHSIPEKSEKVNINERNSKITMSKAPLCKGSCCEATEGL